MIEETKKYSSEAVVHHIHHKTPEETANRRELAINGSIYSVTLTSSDPGDNMEYLCKKALEILKQLKQECG